MRRRSGRCRGRARSARFPGKIGKLIQPSIPAALEAETSAGDCREAAVGQNMRRVVRELREDASSIILDAQERGALMVVDAIHELASGAAHIFDLPDA